MIPAPPSDPALPGLETALDGAAMAEALRAAGLWSDFRLEVCRPVYVRYKRATSCLVQYELVLRDGDGEAASTTGHVKVHADGSAERLWGSPSFGRLVKRARRRHAGTPVGAALLPSLGALFQVFPVDAALPALARATARRKLRRGLAAAGALAANERLSGLELVRYKPGRKALFRLDAERATLYAKVYPDGEAAPRFRATSVLAATGAPTEAPLALVPPLEVVAQREVLGRRLAVVRGSKAYVAALEPAADALSRLHGCRAAGLPRHTLRREAETIEAAGQAAAQLVPALAGKATGVARRIAGLLEDEECGEAVPVHGDFYDDQVLIADGVALLIDFDEARLGDARLDVGTFLAHLSADGDADAARAAFVDAYAAGRPHGASNLGLFEAAALLRLATGPFRRLEPDWPAGVGRLVALAEARLDEGRTSRGDPALPQLRRLLDRTAMSRTLGEALARPVRVTDVSVIRHKPRRRCTLRYDLESAGRRQAVYAKTYASERASRVHDSLVALAAGVRTAEAVTVSEPLACLPSLHVVLQRELAGAPVRTGDRGVVARVAEALHELHCCGARLHRVHGIEDELGPLPGRVERLVSVYPDLERQARRCLALALAGPPAGTRWRLRPAHRDFYPAQVRLAGGCVGLLDLDDAAMADPALDVANFAAHLRLEELECVDEADSLAGARTAFCRRYAELDAQLAPALMRFLEGTTLLRLAEIHGPRGGEGLAVRLLAECERLLTGAT